MHPQLLYFTILTLVWFYVYQDEEIGNEKTSEKPTETSRTPKTSLADRIIQLGEQFLGTPYQYGALVGQTNTFDCSSFVQYLFGQHGISLPRTSRQQSTLGITITREKIQRGDLLFFKSSASSGIVRHVGIYAGNDLVLHIWGTKGVHYESLSHSLLEQSFLFAKRIIDAVPEVSTA